MSDLSAEERAARAEASRQAALAKLRARREAERDRILSYLTEESWREVLQDEFTKPYWEDLVKFLMNEEKAVFPPDEHIFAALNACPFDSVKAVILGSCPASFYSYLFQLIHKKSVDFVAGQDPYHGPRQAHGMCFSVNKGVGIPPSLVNIYRELAADSTFLALPPLSLRGSPRAHAATCRACAVSCCVSCLPVPGFRPPNHGYLMQWAKQGVLLLNTVLTVAYARHDTTHAAVPPRLMGGPCFAVPRSCYAVKARPTRTRARAGSTSRTPSSRPSTKSPTSCSCCGAPRPRFDTPLLVSSHTPRPINLLTRASCVSCRVVQTKKNMITGQNHVLTAAHPSPYSADKLRYPPPFSVHSPSHLADDFPMMQGLLRLPPLLAHKRPPGSRRARSHRLVNFSCVLCAVACVAC